MRRREQRCTNEERRGGELEPELGQRIPGRPCVHAVKHSKALQSVVKFIRFVFANIAALNAATLPLNYVQLELDMNIG